MRKLTLLIMSMGLLISSCDKSEIESGGKVSKVDREKLIGMWAVIDDKQMCNEYIKFDHMFTQYQSSKKYLAHNKTIWRAEKSDFKSKESIPFSLSNAILYLDGNKWGKAVLSGDTLKVGGIKYLKVEGFNEGYGCSIKLKKSPQPIYDYTSGEGTVEIEIVDPIPNADAPTAVSGKGWIRNVMLDDNVITFSLSENNSREDRTGDITVIYEYAESFYIQINQSGTLNIVTSPSSINCTYAGGTFDFTYTIEKPREGLSVEVSKSVDWITDLTHSGNKISFNVSENNNRSYRACKITLTYGSLTEEYNVFQEGAGDLSLSSATDLSLSGTSNCYIVSSSDAYKFKTVKGNSSTSVGSVTSAEVLWESFGTSTTPPIGALIEDVAYSDGYIGFYVPETLREGNAVIAAKDANGKILWSWHIWLTDQPEDQVYNNNAGTMMDRNLGATSATLGDVGALGLLYQWGRKDPFLGSSSISSDTKAESTIAWPSAVFSDSSNGTITYATEHPTTFIKYNSSNYDWYYTGSSSTDNTRWQSDKTIYDPCPPGYRVPDGGSSGVWSKAFGTSSDFYKDAYDSTNEGFNFGSSVSTNKLTSSSPTCWYPAAGYLYDDDDSLYDVGNIGSYWSCSPFSDDAYFLYFTYGGSVDPSGYSSRVGGHSVRCLRE